MALSNWDVAAWNTNGEPCKGEAKLGDVEFEVYKAEIRMNVCGVSITSESGDSHFSIGNVEVFIKTDYNPARVYLFASKAIFNSETKKFDIERFFAIGAYGYNDEGDFIGVTSEIVADYKYWYRGLDIWTDDRKIELQDARRYNLGDAYFAHQLGGEVRDVCTNVGKQNPTIMNRIINSWNNPEGGQNVVKNKDE